MIHTYGVDQGDPQKHDVHHEKGTIQMYGDKNSFRRIQQFVENILFHFRYTKNMFNRIRGNFLSAAFLRCIQQNMHMSSLSWISNAILKWNISIPKKNLVKVKCNFGCCKYWQILQKGCDLGIIIGILYNSYFLSLRNNRFVITNIQNAKTGINIYAWANYLGRNAM